MNKPKEKKMYNRSSSIIRLNRIPDHREAQQEETFYDPIRLNHSRRRKSSKVKSKKVLGSPSPPANFPKRWSGEDLPVPDYGEAQQEETFYDPDEILLGLLKDIFVHKKITFETRRNAKHYLDLKSDDSDKRWVEKIASADNQHVDTVIVHFCFSALQTVFDESISAPVLTFGSEDSNYLRVKNIYNQHSET